MLVDAYGDASAHTWSAEWSPMAAGIPGTLDAALAAATGARNLTALCSSMQSSPAAIPADVAIAGAWSPAKAEGIRKMREAGRCEPDAAQTHERAGLHSPLAYLQ